MKKPLFSIVIPCYNVEKYLEGAIQSVLVQSFKDWEIILIDDGSKDSTATIIESYAKIDSRIHSYFQMNKGVSEARNLGIKYASGKYVYFFDADDIIDNGLLTYLANLLFEESPDLIVFGYRKVDSNKKVIRRRTPKENRLYKGDKALGNLLLALEDNELFNPPWNKLYKLDIIIQNKISFSALTLGEDAVFNYCFFRKLNTIYSVAKPLYTYVTMRNGSATKRQNKFQLLVFNTLNEQKKITMNKFGLNTDMVYETASIVACYDLMKRAFLQRDSLKSTVTNMKKIRKQSIVKYGFWGTILRCSIKNKIKLFLIYHIQLFKFILCLQLLYLKLLRINEYVKHM